MATHVGVPSTYTLDAGFDEGSLINVNYTNPDQLQLDDIQEAFDFIWVAASLRGTIVKIDTRTGDILGEYQSAPNGRGRNPSRTTVDQNGNVWAGNRGESSGGQGSVVQVGLEENGQCEDRNGNGVIDTSTGLGVIMPWSNTGGVDNAGGVSTADDECIIKYVRVAGTNTRHLSVTQDGDVWTSGTGTRAFDLVDGETGAILASFSSVGCGGYGGLVDSNGVIWSATLSAQLLRYDTNGTHDDTSDDTSACLQTSRYTYGLGIDSNGNIWNSQWTYNSIIKVDPTGITFAGFPKSTGGAGGDRGVAVTLVDNNVWIANSGGSDVSRLDNDGNLVAVIPVGSMPTGVSVDALGMVWVTNYGSDSVSRIDPATNLVDLTVNLGVGARPYNYSDMTGSTLLGRPENGTWSVTHDSGADTEWGRVSWFSFEPGDSSIVVTVASSPDDITYGAPEVAVNGGSLSSVAAGQYLKVIASFVRSTSDEDLDEINDSPILFDLTVNDANDPPTCVNSAAGLWPPNHKMKAINIPEVSDPDGDVVTITVTGVTQDELVEDEGDGNTGPDAVIDGGTVSVRAERSGLGDGRVYAISYTASDGSDSCQGTIEVSVPHDKNSSAVDSGQTVDSTLP